MKKATNGRHSRIGGGVPSHQPGGRGRRLVTIRRLVALVGVVSLSLVIVAAARVSAVQEYSRHSIPQQMRITIDSQRRYSCANTLGSSANMVADSRGNLCEVDDLGPDGCCCRSHIRERDKSKTCQRCQGDCCLEYEQCVACCMDEDSSITRGEVRRRASHAVLALANDDFALCKFRCLTNSGSVLHQNSYRNKLKHCFGTERSRLDTSMSINSVDPETAFDDIDADLQDPYISGRNKNGSYIFPCTTQGCATPEQDRDLLHKARRADRANTQQKQHRLVTAQKGINKNKQPYPARLRGVHKKEKLKRESRHLKSSSRFLERRKGSHRS